MKIQKVKLFINEKDIQKSYAYMVLKYRKYTALDYSFSLLAITQHCRDTNINITFQYVKAVQNFPSHFE